MKLLESPPTSNELKAIRLIYRLTPKEMGEVLGVSAQTVRSYETGKTRIPWKHLKRINQLLSKPVPPAPLSPDELRLLRTRQELAQKQTAETFRVSVTSTINYENGHTSIPSGLPECIKGLAEPKAAPTPVSFASHHSAHQLLEEYSRIRVEEREQWLSLSQDITPVDLSKLRLARGLSQEKLANMLGISKSTLHSYESGRLNIPQGLVERIVKLCPDAVISPIELHELRTTLDLSQSELASFLGLSSGAIQHYEAGTRKISYTLSEKIMQFFQEEASTELISVDMKECRNRLNLSQKAFAELLGVSQAAVALFETGKRKLPREVRKKILGIETTESE